MYQGPGIYEHYKGKSYMVHGLVLHTETQEEMVLYTPLYVGMVKSKDGKTSWPGMFVRPRKMFDEKIYSEQGNPFILRNGTAAVVLDRFTPITLQQ